MQNIANARDAKEFLIAKIAWQAEREGVPLSEVERKMLYFSETGRTLPDMAETSGTFDRDYDQGKYEQKIGTLANNFCAQARKTNPMDLASWKEAARTIGREDHYLTILIKSGKASTESRLADRLKLVAVAFLTTALLLAGALLFAGK